MDLVLSFGREGALPGPTPLGITPTPDRNRPRIETDSRNTRGMKKVFTAKQISDWFTSGTAFANVRLTEDAAGRESEGPEPSGTRWDKLHEKVRGRLARSPAASR